MSESYGKLPLHFEANQGQAHEDVRFLSRGLGYSLYLTASEAVVVLTQPGADAQPESTALRMGLVGAARKPFVSGLEELPGKANHFVGSDPAKWRTNVPLYGKVRYRDVYPGIDLVYYGNQRQLEYDFVVAPGADPKKIVLAFKGPDKIEIDAQGDLVLHVDGESIRQKKPVIYQEVDGTRQTVAGHYVRKGPNRVGFKVAAYDTSRPLVIDPVLAYSTFLGGIQNDRVDGIAVDAAGNAYVTGLTTSTNFPTTAGAVQTISGGGGSDVFVAKLDPTGTALVYSTYLGGSGSDNGAGIVVAGNGNAYVVGTTDSPNFPTTAGAFQGNYRGGDGDAFVVRLNSNGSSLVYSTYVGGSGRDFGDAIALDASGNAYLTGTTLSMDFPTAGALQSTHGGGPANNPADAFVTKLNAAGSALVYSTYLGGSDSDHGFAITVSADGSAHLTGQTWSSDFPTTSGAFQPSFGGVTDGFVAKLVPTGSALGYSTYLGGSFGDAGWGIALDGAGNAFVTGHTHSSDFPTTAGVFQPVHRGLIEAFITKIGPTGSLGFSTFLGGDAREVGRGIALDASDNIYVVGYTESTNFPVTTDAFQGAKAAREDVFVSRLNSTGAFLMYSTFLGGNDTDLGVSIAAAGTAAYIAGHTRSTNFPVTPGALQATMGGGGCFSAFVSCDGFVARFADTPPSGQTPYNGTPSFLPGVFEAEHFDRGGQGVAYHDNVPGNAGGQLRPDEDVDIVPSLDAADAGGGFVVWNFETGEWLAYTVHIPASTSYSIELRASTSADFPNPAYHVEIDGVNVTGTVVLANTGGWNNFRWVGKVTVQLPAGQHILKIVSERQYFNLNRIRVTSSTASTPHTGTPFPVPSSWSAVGFDNGGEGVAYHDNVPGNAGGQFRPDEDVDITTSGGSFVVHNFETREWLLYTINVQTTGFYDIRLFTSSEFANSAFHVEIDDTNVTGRVTVPNTGNWNNFRWVVAKQGIRLTAGQHLLRVFADQQYFNLRDVWVVAAPTPTPFTGKPVQLPALIEAENFDNGGEGVAYHDNVPGNAGGQYRNGESVDVIVSTDAGPPTGGFVVNNFETGEWLVYTVNSPGGLFEIDLRAATSPDFPGAAYRLEIDGVNVSGTVVLPDTGGWNNFQWVGRVLARIAPGQHVLRIVSERQYFNLNAIKVAPRPN